MEATGGVDMLMKAYENSSYRVFEVKARLDGGRESEWVTVRLQVKTSESEFRFPTIGDTIKVSW